MRMQEAQISQRNKSALPPKLKIEDDSDIASNDGTIMINGQSSLNKEAYLTKPDEM